MGNYQFDFTEWVKRFPLIHRIPAFSDELPIFEPEDVTSPEDICLNEQLREAAEDIVNWGPSSPVDVFIMASGEPADRQVTKIGGVPYRPSGTPWPLNQQGDPMTFLAQFCFADSKDITGALPGDVLLCFSPTDDPPQNMEFEWYPLGIRELIPRDDVPIQPWRFAPCHGYRYRTKSFPEARLKRGLDPGDDHRCRGIEIRSIPMLFQFQATQIGRAPFYIQFDDDKNAIVGQPLCVINSVNPSYHEPYPWVNRPEPLYRKGEAAWRQNEFLQFGDAGCVYISMDDDGRMYSHMSCY